MKPKTVHEHLYRLKNDQAGCQSGYTPARPLREAAPGTAPAQEPPFETRRPQKTDGNSVGKPNLQRVRDWFLFATFTGLSYADLKRLSEKDITQSDDGTYWIHIRRQKTETPSAIRLLNVPLQIIEKYRHERKSDRIFNLYCRGYLIKLTRELGRTYGFDMTFHKARHNFGTHITLSLGVPIETVSRMMGHKSISTTQIYAKVTDRKVDEDMKRLKEQTKGRKINLYEEDEPETADIITVNG